MEVDDSDDLRAEISKLLAAALAADDGHVAEMDRRDELHIAKTDRRDVLHHGEMQRRQDGFEQELLTIREALETRDLQKSVRKPASWVCRSCSTWPCDLHRLVCRASTHSSGPPELLILPPGADQESVRHQVRQVLFDHRARHSVFPVKPLSARRPRPLTAQSRRAPVARRQVRYPLAMWHPPRSLKRRPRCDVDRLRQRMRDDTASRVIPAVRRWGFVG